MQFGKRGTEELLCSGNGVDAAFKQELSEYRTNVQLFGELFSCFLFLRCRSFYLPFVIHFIYFFSFFSFSKTCVDDTHGYGNVKVGKKYKKTAVFIPFLENCGCFLSGTEQPAWRQLRCSVVISGLISFGCFWEVHLCVPEYSLFCKQRMLWMHTRYLCTYHLYPKSSLP